MKVTNYSASLRYFLDIGPQISECINPSTLLALLLLLENVALAYLPRAHPLHKSSRSVLSSGTPNTIFLRIIKAPWCNYPILLCHSSFKSLSPLLSISSIGDSSCNMYNLLLFFPIWAFFFQYKCLTYTFSLMKKCHSPCFEVEIQRVSSSPILAHEAHWLLEATLLLRFERLQYLFLLEYTLPYSPW